MGLSEGEDKQVNSWGTYHSTARTARFLGGRFNTITTANNNSRTARLRYYEHRSAHVLGRDVEAGNASITNTHRLGRSVHGTSDTDHWSRSFIRHSQHVVDNVSRHSSKHHQQLSQSLHGVEEDHRDDDNNDDDEEEKDDDENQKKERKRKRKQYSPRMKALMRDLFSVYFEGVDDCYDYYDENVEVATGDGSTTIASPKRKKKNMCAVATIVGGALSSLSATMPWLPVYIRRRYSMYPMLRGLLLGTEASLRGMSQVYFQSNPFCGLLIAIALLVQSTTVAVHGFLALLSGNLLGRWFGFDRALIGAGLFGYNSLLVGLAIATFSSSPEDEGYTAESLIGAIVFGAFSSIVFVMLGKILVTWRSPPLTLPFNVATMLFLLSTNNMSRVTTIGPVSDPSLPDYHLNDSDINNEAITARAFFAGVIRGIGQVFLAEEISSGIMILVGLFFCSRIAATAALLGSAVGLATALATGVPSAAIESGLFGYNSSLTATAMLMFYAPSFNCAILGFLAAIITVVGQQALSTLFQPYGLPVMTTAFCAVALPFIIIQGTTTFVVAVPLSTMTIPEVHLRRVRILKDGFLLLKEAIEEPNSSGPSNMKYVGRKMTRSLSSISAAFSEDDGIPSGHLGRLCRCSSPFSEAVDEKLTETATEMFEALGEGKDITHEQIMEALDSIDLTDEVGKDFAGSVLKLIDIDQSLTISEREFVAFVKVSSALKPIYRKVSQFFEFVDSNGNGCIDTEELNASLEYLGQSALSEMDVETLVLICGVNDNGEFQVLELTRFVIVSKIRSLLAVYRDGTSQSALHQ